MISVLIVEDDVDLGNLLTQYLALNNFEPKRVFNGIQAWEMLNEHTFDIVILDVMMPDMNGFTLAEKMKTKLPNQPFLFITALNQKKDKLKGLGLGADDYITKPFDADELILRVKNILKRYPSKDEVKTYKIGAFSFKPQELKLIFNDEKQMLTEKEANLLRLLCENKNTLIRKEKVLENLWSEADFFSARSLDVFISRLRKYLKKDTNISIESIRGVGYIFNVKEA